MSVMMFSLLKKLKVGAVGFWHGLLDVGRRGLGIGAIDLPGTNSGAPARSRQALWVRRCFAFSAASSVSLTVFSVAGESLMSVSLPSP